MLLTLELKKQRQEDLYESEASLVYMFVPGQSGLHKKFCLKKQINK